MACPSIPATRSLPRAFLLLGTLALACGEEPPDSSPGGTSSGSTAAEPGSTSAAATGGSGATPEPGPTGGPSGDGSTGGLPPPQTTGSSGSDSSGSDSSGGLVLEGDPPAAATYTAVDDGDFVLLGDDDEFTTFSDNGDRVQILPLRDENFPPDVDYCTVGSDDELNGLQQWARAQLVPVVPKTWVYDVTLTAVVEEDGESEFALVVNGEIVDTVTNPVTDTTPGLDDMDDYAHVWESVPLYEGDTVEVWGKAHSNLGLEEAAGCRDWSPTYAWARGRWRLLELAPTPGVG